MSTTAGIDIGSEAIKAVVLRATKNGMVEVVAAGAIALGELGHMEDGIDKSLATSTKLKELVRTARISADTRRVGVAGKNTSIKYLQVPPVPPERLDMLVKYEVEEKNGESDSAYDYRILDVPEVGGQYTVMIGVCKESASADLLNIAKNGKLGEVEVDLEALALYNAYYHGHGFDADKTVLIADIGADDITMLLCKNGLLYFARTIMGGGRRFTQVLADELKIDVLEAEELKKAHAEIKFDIPTPSAGRTGRIPRTGMTGIIPRPGQTGVGMRAPGSSAVAGAAAPGASGTSAPAPAPAAGTPAAGSGAAVPPSLPVIDIPAPAASTTGSEKTSEQTLITSGPIPSLPSLPDDIVLDMPPSSDSLDLTSPSSISSAPQALMNMVQTGPDMTDEKRKRQMSAALVREAASLCAALENAVLASKQQTKLREMKVDRLYITGGGGRLKGLIEFMSRRMRLEVLPLEPFKQLSMDKLPADQAAALKAEQHNMSVALGLALSDLQKNSISFLLWPNELQQKKIWWARGAYLVYAAALIALSFGLFLWMPLRNASALAANAEKAKVASDSGRKQTSELDALRTLNEQRRKEFEQLYENTHSGEYFLKLLDELKNKKVISDDLWLTQITTSVPEVLRRSWETDSDGNTLRTEVKPDAMGADSDEQTLQAQKRVYLRGFVRGTKDAQELFDKIDAFKLALVPDVKNPDSPKNWLFKQVDTVYSPPNNQTDRAYKLKEFVLECYLEVPPKEPEKADAKSVTKPVKKAPAPAAAPVEPAVAPAENKSTKKFVTPENPGAAGNK